VAGCIRIRRIQLKNGAVSEVTKTDAGLRDIPMSPSLKEALLAWRLRCPRNDGRLERVFPAPGRLRAWPQTREGGGGPLLYNNFRARIWAPFLKKLGLPAVTPHSACHAFISTLQAQGVEVASSRSLRATRARSSRCRITPTPCAAARTPCRRSTQAYSRQGLTAAVR